MIPRLYAIVDTGVLAARGISPAEYSSELVHAGVGLIQYRDKTSSPGKILETAAQIRLAMGGKECRLILNDRPDLAVLANADGVHIGQLDLSPEDTRTVVGRNRLIGLSTHNDVQLQAAHLSCADYLAIGPVFSTGTKANPDPVVGLEGVRRARELTRKPLVAIGGITRQNARSVIEAGADSVALVSGLLSATETNANVVRDFLDILG
jgi:thiamine-phosphate pyrophosphorylase